MRASRAAALDPDSFTRLIDASGTTGGGGAFGGALGSTRPPGALTARRRLGARWTLDHR
jgi:hypothetical protein